MNLNALLNALGNWFSELVVLRDALREKGPRYFLRAFGLGFVMIFFSYQLIYKRSKQALATTKFELNAVQATAQYASDYQSLKARLQELYATFPKTNDPGSWLLKEVRESLRKEGLVPTSFSSPTETTMEGYRIVSLTVACQASYKEIASWIARVEREHAHLSIRTFDLQKDDAVIGNNRITVMVAMILPTASAAL